MRKRIYAVIVLYKVAVEESTSYLSLLRSVLQAGFDSADFGILLYDNSPQAASHNALPSNVTYYHDPENSGLARAYNIAIEKAQDQGFEWLLTLDQDTCLPPGFFQSLAPILDELDNHLDVAAVVPQVRSSGRSVSPHSFFGGFWTRFFPPGYKGVPEHAVYAFNSGSVLRLAALRQIGGYAPWFWLDSSDLHLYRQLARFGKRVYVAGQIQVDHDFSMLNMEERISTERYRNILLAESAFWDAEMNTLAGLERTARLALRLFKHWRRGDRPELRQLTREGLRNRIFRSRRSRLASWRQITTARLGTLALTHEISDRPMVSVCMAAYNGERYIEDQLRSILSQLDATDEIVIVDDASRDGTREVIRSVQDSLTGAASPRIFLVEHRENQGLVRTFEEAVRSATGDILFLADNDDLWAPGKVAKVLQAFASAPESQIVTTGVSIIDEQGRSLPAEVMRLYPFKTNLVANLIHNRYQGSAMALRSSLLRHILPFPAGKLFLHDCWIGARNTFAGGSASYVDEPLLLYRRHGSNFSQRFNLYKQFLLRFQLVTTLLRHLRQSL